MTFRPIRRNGTTPVDDIPCRERVEKLRARLIEALTGREEGFTDGRRLIPGRPTVEVLGQRL